jgi:hypothetical protein
MTDAIELKEDTWRKIEEWRRHLRRFHPDRGVSRMTALLLRRAKKARSPDGFIFWACARTPGGWLSDKDIDWALQKPKEFRAYRKEPQPIQGLLECIAP